MEANQSVKSSAGPLEPEPPTLLDEFPSELEGTFSTPNNPANGVALKSDEGTLHTVTASASAQRRIPSTAEGVQHPAASTGTMRRPARRASERLLGYGSEIWGFLLQHILPVRLSTWSAGLFGLCLGLLISNQFLRPDADTDGPRSWKVVEPKDIVLAGTGSVPAAARGQSLVEVPAVHEKPSVAPDGLNAVLPLIRQPRPLPSAKRVRFVGDLFVSSVPLAAAVFIDQKYVGETPLKLSGLRAGSHVVWLERAGHERWTNAVTVRANVLNRVAPKLQPDRRQTD